MTVNGQAYPVSLVLPNGSTLTGTLQFTDAGDQPGSGGGGGAPDIPISDQSGAFSLDTTTYANPITNDGSKLATAVFATLTALMAVANEGDDFPRILLGTDPAGTGWFFGDGTVDPSGAGASMVISNVNGVIGVSWYGADSSLSLTPDPRLLFDGGGWFATMSSGGVSSDMPAGISCFVAGGTNGATVALDAGGLLVQGFQGLPTADPHVAGQLYTTTGAVFVSAG